MKNKITLIMWIATALCIILAIVFWFLMNNQDISYEEVTAVVTSATSKEVVNKKTGSRTPFYTVKVKYEGKEYELKNVHGLSGYTEGRSVKALLSKGKLYANKEGIKSSTWVATIYFVFLFGSIGMLIATQAYASKVKAKNQAKV